MRRDSGFGLVEVLIAMGVASILTLGVATFLGDTMKNTRSVSLSTDFNNLVSTLHMLVNDEQRCSAILQSTTYPTGSHPVASVPQITLQGTTIAKLNQTIGGLKTTQLDLIGLPVIPADAQVTLFGGTLLTKLTATLRITVEKTGEVIGAKSLQKDFVVTVLANPADNKILHCYGEVSKTEIIETVRASLKQEICQELGGGYDVASGRCTPVSVKNLAGGVPNDSAATLKLVTDYLDARTQNRAVASPPAQSDPAEVARLQQQLQQRFQELQRQLSTE